MCLFDQISKSKIQDGSIYKAASLKIKWKGFHFIDPSSNGDIILYPQALALPPLVYQFRRQNQNSKVQTTKTTHFYGSHGPHVLDEPIDLDLMFLWNSSKGLKWKTQGGNIKVPKVLTSKYLRGSEIIFLGGLTMVGFQWLSFLIHIGHVKPIKE